MQDEQRRQDSQRQEEQRRQDEQRRQEERRRQEQRAQEERRKQERQQREDSQRQEQEPAREERLKEETRRKEENSQRKDDKTPQSQELRDLANTEDKYMRLVKSGYYDEKRAEKAAEKTEGGNGMEQMKKAPTKGGFSERREALKTKVQDAPKIDTAYAEEMARKLSALRSEFVKAMVQSAERTSYQPNPIYERQANEIESISKTISEQSRTIKSLQEERDKLGIFKGREKKELQNKIDNFERLRRSNLDKLGALGVSEPSKADEAVKEKRSVAAQEQNRAKAAMQNRGAKERAEEVKAAFLEAAKQIPADQRQEILDRMGQQKEIPTMGRLQYYQAEAEARRQLDTALKQEAQTRERNRTHDRDRGI